MSRTLIFLGIIAIVVVGGFAVFRSNGQIDANPEATAAPVPTESADLPEVAEPTVPADPTDEPAAAPEDGNPTPPEYANESPPSGVTNEFSTDFSRHTISYGEVLSGGPPKDGIPAVDAPVFVTVAEADAWLRPEEPVIFLQVAGEGRAYPIQILTWHEIVNDTLGGEPVVITFCPLCNTAIAFERTFEGQVLDFGTTGRLRLSNLIMYDRQTETWWQQASGEGVVGEYAGSQLTFLPATIISWEDFKANYPESMVLSRETGYSRSYGNNPYAGYDNINNSPFLFTGPDNSDKLPPMARVLTIDLNGESVAYPFTLLEASQVVNDQVGGEPVVVIWETGTESAFLADNISGQYLDVGTASGFSRRLEGTELTFQVVEGEVVDDQTGSVWNVLGQAVSGELAGSQLDFVVSVNHFWFSWAAFRPETRIYKADV